MLSLARKHPRPKLAIIGGARPNFMKIFPLCQACERASVPYVLINTGQHFDAVMAADFFKEFGLKPDYSLAPSRHSVVQQMADIMTGLEKIFLQEQPDMVVVVGDVNSTLMGALVANKMGLPLAHIEAGLRSFNKQMPEEHNRKLSDYLANYLFVTMEDGVKNLRREGITQNVFLVGNIMIDTVKFFSARIDKTNEKFYFCTLHRPENVDHKNIFSQIVKALEVIAQDAPVYFSLHPRTRKRAEEFSLLTRLQKICRMLPPLSYQQSLFYQKNAQLVLTDSGGVQEETSFFGVPCLTLRRETERPVTIRRGTNTIAGVTKNTIVKAYRQKKRGLRKTKIPLWDGHTAQRIVAKLIRLPLTLK